MGNCSQAPAAVGVNVETLLAGILVQGDKDFRAAAEEGDPFASLALSSELTTGVLILESDTIASQVGWFANV